MKDVLSVWILETDLSPPIPGVSIFKIYGTFVQVKYE